MQVHAGAGQVRERLGHEAGDAAVPARDAAHGTLEQHCLVDRAQRVRAMFQRDLELTGCVLRHQRAHRQALCARGRVQVVEQRRHVVQPAEPVGVYLRTALRGQQPARRPQPALGVTLEQVELELDRDHRRISGRGQPLDHARQHVARVGARRRAVQFVHRAEHLPGRPRQPRRTAERPRHRAALQVCVADFPDEAGLLDVLAGHVEAEDRARHVAASGIQRRQFRTVDVLAAADAVRVGDHELYGLDVRVCVEEGARLRLRAGDRVSDGVGHADDSDGTRSGEASRPGRGSAHCRAWRAAAPMRQWTR